MREFQPFEVQAHKRVAILNEASCIEDVMKVPSNRFEALGGDPKDSFSINDQWRICFNLSEGDAHDVVDYH